MGNNSFSFALATAIHLLCAEIFCSSEKWFTSQNIYQNKKYFNKTDRFNQCDNFLEYRYRTRYTSYIRLLHKAEREAHCFNTTFPWKSFMLSQNLQRTHVACSHSSSTSKFWGRLRGIWWFIRLMLDSDNECLGPWFLEKCIGSRSACSGGTLVRMSMRNSFFASILNECSGNLANRRDCRGDRRWQASHYCYPHCFEEVFS